MCIDDYFKLPIEYNANKQSLSANIIEDLELIKSKEQSDGIVEPTLYSHVFNPTNILGKLVIPSWSKYYTSDTLYLKDTQSLITQLKIDPISTDVEVYNSWNNFKKETSFKDKYQYLSWNALEPFNRNTSVMYVLGLFNLGAPMLSLLMPVFLLIMPFFVLKLQGMKINVASYINLIKIIFANHSMFKLFTQFGSAPLNQKAYMLMSCAFFIMQVYQNVAACIQFYKNIHTITNFLRDIKLFLIDAKYRCDMLLQYTSSLKSYSEFNSQIQTYSKLTEVLFDKLNLIIDQDYTILKLSQIGYIMKSFYEVFHDDEFEKVLMYHFGMSGYLDNISQLQVHLKNKMLNRCTYSKKTQFKKSYYAALKNKKVVKNSYKLNKNYIITGPNAAGKTTLLKSTLFNIICSQQFGMGFYKSAKLNPYEHLHCYLNIPDTSGRDSLFQAEARRCKEILQFITQNQHERHFCIFDELYSGTNPDDAVESANAFIHYLCNKSNVQFILTTHYTKLCNQLDDNPKIRNSSMKIIQSTADKHRIQYTYQLTKGICSVKGGKQVLIDLGYPDEILQLNS